MFRFNLNLCSFCEPNDAQTLRSTEFEPISETVTVSAVACHAVLVPATADVRPSLNTYRGTVRQCRGRLPRSTALFHHHNTRTLLSQGGPFRIETDPVAAESNTLLLHHMTQPQGPSFFLFQQHSSLNGQYVQNSSGPLAQWSQLLVSGREGS